MRAVLHLGDVGAVILGYDGRAALLGQLVLGLVVERADPR